MLYSMLYSYEKIQSCYTHITSECAHGMCYMFWSNVHDKSIKLPLPLRIHLYVVLQAWQAVPTRSSNSSSYATRSIGQNCDIFTSNPNHGEMARQLFTNNKIINILKWFNDNKIYKYVFLSIDIKRFFLFEIMQQLFYRIILLFFNYCNQFRSSFCRLCSKNILILSDIWLYWICKTNRNVGKNYNI